MFVYNNYMVVIGKMRQRLAVVIILWRISQRCVFVHRPHGYTLNEHHVCVCVTGCLFAHTAQTGCMH